MDEQHKTMPLPVVLGDVEVQIRTQELLTAEQELGHAELSLQQVIRTAKAEKEQALEEIADCRLRVHDLADVVRQRKEVRDVAIVFEPDFDIGAMNTIRVDTGEVISSRSLSAEERQRSMFRPAAVGAKP